MSAEYKTCQRKKILTGASLACSPPNWLWSHYGRSPERYADGLQGWVSEFNDFIRDHRSQDAVILEVRKEYREVCSSCGAGYEDYVSVEEGHESCGRCGAIYTAKEPANG